jgi:hypothetical protein
MSFSQINTELGLTSTATISLNDSAVRTLAGVAASPATISITNLSGKANQYSLTISSNQTNLNLRSYAVTAGWNQSSKLVATINSGVYISSNSTGTPALTVSGSFPGGVSLINGGVIVGMGGIGADGAGQINQGYGPGPTAGGLALSVSSAISITNNNIIAGGGGGGGGGGSMGYYGPKGLYFYPGSGGGGGQSSLYNSDGGYVGAQTPGYAGGQGTISGPGAGGNGIPQAPITIRSGSGGAGGSWGSTGVSGAQAIVSQGYFRYPDNPCAPPCAGSSGGGAVSGNSNITWVATGTRYGGIS